MKKYIVFLFSLLISFFCFSQKSLINGLIIARDSSLVSYATIYSETLKIGCISDSAGYFILPNTGEPQRIVVKYVGYKTKVVNIPVEPKDTVLIIIDPDTIKIKEVVIKPRQRKNMVEYLPNSKIKGYIMSCSGYTYQCGIYVRNVNNIKGKIEKLNFMIKNPYTELAKFRVRIYAVDDNLMPKNEILKKNLVISIPRLKKFNFVEIDISEHDIMFLERGVVVTMEWLMLSENRYYYSSDHEKGRRNNGYRAQCFAPILALVENRDANIFDMYSKRDEEGWHTGSLTSNAVLNKGSFTGMLPYIKVIISY